MLKDSDGDNIGDAIDYEPNTPNAFNPFSSSCFNFVEYYYSKYYTDDDEQSIRDCYRLILTKLMVCVHKCRRPDLVSDEDWLAFCKQFNRCVREVGEVDETLHYFRLKLNRAPATLDEMIALINSTDNIDDKWIMCCPNKGRCHMFGENGTFNIKFISSNNTDNMFEAVYDINGNLVLDEKTLVHIIMQVHHQIQSNMMILISTHMKLGVIRRMTILQKIMNKMTS